MIPPVVLWVDPGGDTGLAWLWQSGTAFFADEWKFMEAGDHVEDSCARWGPALTIGYETYTIIPGTPQDDAHHAIEMIGVVRRYATRYRCRLLSARPEQRKKATRAMLEALGWWVPGKDDAQSAAQHMLAWLMREGQMTPAIAAVLSEAARNV